MFKNIKKLWGTALVLSAFSSVIPAIAYAQTTACVTPPSCEELGYVYTTSQCTSGYLKCPFDLLKVYCTYETKVGDILYSDMSTSPVVLTTKKPIGVVFDLAKRLAIGLKFEMTQNSNSADVVENVGLTDGKVNTQLLMAYAKTHTGVTMPAAEYCSTYSTEGTKAGDWFLLSASELSLLNSKWGSVTETMARLGVSLSLPGATSNFPAQMLQNSSQSGNTHMVIIGDMSIKMPTMGDGYPTFPVISF